MKQIVTLPNIAAGFHYHPEHESFRALVHYWEQSGLVEIRRSASPYCWWGNVGDVLLYDRPTLDWFSEKLKYKLGLFANPNPPLNGRNNVNWTFWARHPKLIEHYAKFSLSHHRRKFSCTFIGGYENRVQRSQRYLEYWRPACDNFISFGSVAARAAELRPEEYIRTLRQSKYGLCLRGFGPKCQREIECMALGVVPIFTPGVSTSYYNPLYSGIHYLVADTPSMAFELSVYANRLAWAEMAMECKDYFDRHCSIAGSFQTTKRIIEERA